MRARQALFRCRHHSFSYICLYLPYTFPAIYSLWSLYPPPLIYESGYLTRVVRWSYKFCREKSIFLPNQAKLSLLRETFQSLGSTFPATAAWLQTTTVAWQVTATVLWHVAATAPWLLAATRPWRHPATAAWQINFLCHGAVAHRCNAGVATPCHGGVASRFSLPRRRGSSLPRGRGGTLPQRRGK